MLTWHCEANRDREHIRLFADNGNDKTLTYGQLYDKALGVAAGLAARGVEPGQRVALMLPTGEDYFVAFYAALLAGLSGAYISARAPFTIRRAPSATRFNLARCKRGGFDYQR